MGISEADFIQLKERNGCVRLNAREATCVSSRTSSPTISPPCCPRGKTIIGTI